MRQLIALIFSICLLTGASLLFAQPAPDPLIKNASPSLSKTLILSSFVYDRRDPRMFDRWFNSRVISPRRDENKEKQTLRDEWEEFLGVDVFYPYYKAKSVEKYVQSKTKVDFFKFKGSAEFNEGNSHSFRYIFKKKF
jgi:hypothetical protein